MKGIVLAGGTGSRLWPITRTVSKQLLPVYDKPMIFYPVSTLMLAGIREILIITTPQDQRQFKELLGDGSDLGLSLQYAIQQEPKGLAQAFTIGEDFLNGHSCLMILGDNIFHGAGLGRDILREIPASGAHIFTYEVSNPSDYGILTVGEDLSPISIIEKPPHSESALAVTGLYFFDNKVVDFSKQISPSARGELEITSVLEKYLIEGTLTYTRLSRGAAWLDTGNVNSLWEASSYVRIIEERTGLKIACLEEIAYINGWISKSDLLNMSALLGGGGYARYLKRIAES
jgi:glucose-1-phosphate thymidylyltransferase